jgi:hypothetical protein
MMVGSFLTTTTSIVFSLWNVLCECDQVGHPSIFEWFGELPMSILFASTSLFTISYILYHITFPSIIRDLKVEACNARGYCGVKSDNCPLDGCDDAITDCPQWEELLNKFKISDKTDENN